MVSPSKESSEPRPTAAADDQEPPESPAPLDLATAVAPLARQVIGAVRTRFGTITSSERVTLLSVKGLCAQPDRDPEEWFSDRSRGGQSRLRDRREAARLCDGCPVVRECLEYAVGTRQRYGVWGGMSERDRTVLTRATGRRPRSAGGAGQSPRRTPPDLADGQSHLRERGGSGPRAEASRVTASRVDASGVDDSRISA